MEKLTERTIDELEDEVSQSLFPKVEGYLRLLADTYTFFGSCLTEAYPAVNPNLAKSVCTRLLLRISNDLRAVFLLTNAGYDIQANALAASIYEGAFTLITIGSDANLAKEWVEHRDPKATFRGAKDLTVSAVKNYGLSEEWVDLLYRIYRQFCWGKHLNPISEQQGGFERNEDGSIDWIPGPRADDLTERGICYSTVYSVLFAVMAMDVFVRLHYEENKKQEKMLGLKELGDRQKALFEAGSKRWGSDDPFPNKKW